MMRRPPSSPFFPLHAPLPISPPRLEERQLELVVLAQPLDGVAEGEQQRCQHRELEVPAAGEQPLADRKSTRLNSSHQIISYAVFCLKKKKTKVTIVSAMSAST